MRTLERGDLQVCLLELAAQVGGLLACDGECQRGCHAADVPQGGEGTTELLEGWSAGCVVVHAAAQEIRDGGRPGAVSTGVKRGKVVGEYGCVS